MSKESTYESTNCNECEMEDCPYREEDGQPFYCPIVEGEVTANNH